MYLQKSLFSGFTYLFEAQESYVILGKNGSGKSTLLKILSGQLSISEGHIEWYINQQKIDSNHIFQYIGFSSPYYQLPEEMKLREFLNFHHCFKPFMISIDKIIEILNMEDIQYKPISLYSTGMKQRLKLAQAIFLKAPLLLLDEPISNLDINNIEWYDQQMKNFTEQKLIIIASNNPKEYQFCSQKIDIEKYKNKLIL
ncbi:MAG: ABC transporter ATP-binding protein [Chitinophagaceae bacterium]